MHVLRVATWNAEGMFVEGAMTRRAGPHDGIAALKKLDADIVVIPEFGVDGKVDDSIRVAIHSLGYQIVDTPYDDPTLASHVPKGYGMAVLSRLPLRSHTIHHFDNTNRAFIEATVELPGGKDMLRVFGVHLDDRYEESRLEQVTQLAERITRGHIGETLVMGDFNAMSARSAMAKLFGASSADKLGQRLPGKRLKYVSKRVHEMARGTTIDRLLAETPLHDIDTGHHLTISAKQAGLEWAPKLRLAKIDWILGTKNIRTITYKVLPDVGSDHRPVRASISIT